ncbi:MAG: VOC family protein [Chloroflexota bacterium]|nr:VOC family protein [Chloroflexota bacterium]
MTILGLHHITLVTNDAAKNVDFYTRVLGLRFIRKTVNFDDPSAYHLYYGDEAGNPGTAITFFEWKDATKGRYGIGGTHHFALSVPDYTGLLKWKRRLIDLGIAVDGPFDRHYFKSIYFRDPDGTVVEIATAGPGWTVDEAPDALGTAHIDPPTAMMIQNRDTERITAEMWSEPVPVVTADMALMQGMHHITAISSDIQRTNAFFGDLLGMRLVKRTSNFDDPNSAHWYWGVDDGKPGTLITYFEWKARPGYTPHRAVPGAGQTHHFALAVPDEATQLEWRAKLIKAGYRVSPVMDRTYFKSIYTSDPDGHIVELATRGPGFAVDEPLAELGTHLLLPPGVEAHREMLERVLTPLPNVEWKPAE